MKEKEEVRFYPFPYPLTKKAIFELHPLAEPWLNNTVKHKGFDNLFNLIYLINYQVPTSHIL